MAAGAARVFEYHASLQNPAYRPPGKFLVRESGDPIADISLRCELHPMRLAFLTAACAALTGCGETTACHGLPDIEVLKSIQRAYSSSRMTPEMARNFLLDKERVIAVERFGARGDDAFVGMIFRQDDGSMLSIRLFEDCTYQAGPGRNNADIKSWAYPLKAPRF